MVEKVILVDLNDNSIGVAQKLEAHEKCLLHRAFSIFVFNSNKELMLQQRALDKYHSAGLWSNTCCSHPRPDEDVLSAGQRRLQEEMGFSCQLKEVFSFVYKTELENNLFEHEFDHVLIGFYDKNPEINKMEVESFKFLSLEEIREDLKNNSEKYSYWFRVCFDKVCQNLKSAI